MAITYVGGTSGTGTGASYTVSLNGTLTGGSNSSPSAGDLILVFTGEANSASVTSTCSGNNGGSYSTIRAHQNSPDTHDANLDSFYKFAGATPDTTLTITRGNNNTTYGSATVVHVWRGVNSTNPFNVTPTVASGTNGSAANPAAITPTRAGSIVVYCGHASQVAASGKAFTTAGTNPVSVKGDGSTGDAITMVSSYTAWTSGAYDPAAFTGSTTTTALAWVAVTLVIIPKDYPLTANSGSYTYTGSSITVNRNRALTASSGSYTYTGSSADITKGSALNHRALTASAGSYTYTGSSAVLTKGVPHTFSDDFTGTNGTILSTHDSRWTQHANSAATMELDSNELRRSGTGSAWSMYYYNGDTAIQDCLVGATFKYISDIGQDLRLSARISTTDYSHYCALWRQASAQWEIWSVTSGGGLSVLASSTSLPLNGTSPSREVQFSVVGTALALIVDGTTVCSTTDSTYTSGAVGISTFSPADPTTAGLRFDDFYIDAANNRSITAQSGAYTYSGQSVTLSRGRSLTASAGAYSYSGQSATIRRNRSLTASAGSYVLTGNSVTISRNRVLTTTTRSYTYTGSSATILKNRSLTTQVGSYSITGSSATISRNRVLVASSGSYTYTGQQVTITYTAGSVNYTLTCNGGSYAITGASAILSRNRTLTASGGSYSITGASALLYRNRKLTASGGSYNITGSPATILRSKVLVASSGVYSLTGQSAILSRNRLLVASGGSYTYQGSSAVITKSSFGGYPAESDVLLGVVYGPSGEYTGTLDIGKKFRIDIATGNIVMIIDEGKVMSL